MRELRCKVGDLAIVTRCSVPECIGLLVLVVELCAGEGREWVTKVQGPPVWGAMSIRAALVGVARRFAATGISRLSAASHWRTTRAPSNDGRHAWIDP